MEYRDACVFTLRAWSMVMNEGIIDFRREYLSCQRRSVFTLGSDATKNYKKNKTTNSLCDHRTDSSETFDESEVKKTAVRRSVTATNTHTH